jgi:hypothetical protein
MSFSTCQFKFVQSLFQEARNVAPLEAVRVLDKASKTLQRDYKKASKMLQPLHYAYIAVLDAQKCLKAGFDGLLTPDDTKAAFNRILTVAEADILDAFLESNDEY